MTTSTPPLSIAVLISGGGTTLRNLLEKMSTEALPISIRLVISSSSKAAGLQFARGAKIPTHVVRRRDFDSPQDHSQALFEICQKASVAAVVMGGYLEHVLIPTDFENRVLNIHPALIPAFCGHGFYGHRVHEAVLEYGLKVSGCTVHFVDNQYDHGPIILQRAVAVAEDDTPDSLGARVFEAECQAYPDALRLLAAGRLVVDGRRVRILPASP
jgi:phosphoribosylglycinamide formyltransferase-1